MTVLPTRLLSFRGQIKDGQGVLQWTSTGETDGLFYTVESSDDGAKFTPIGTVHGQAGAGMGASYQFTDPTPLAGGRFYRIRLVSGTYSQYSNQVMLSDGSIEFTIRSLGNPFTDHVAVEVASPSDITVRVSLVDMYGRMVKQQQQTLSQGLNNFGIDGLGGLSNGTYILQISAGDKIITRKMVKLK